ncbi:MAG: hypothetical protein EP330_05095 [Deltaproteobacteria bacterium]|nr:MAG: hypothetical protein EP330_05095 [Deltaproteobacteria bacterium]
MQVAVIDAMPEARRAELLDPWVAKARDPFARSAGAVVLGAEASSETRDALKQDLAQAESWARAPLALAATAVGVEGAVDVLARELASGEIPLELRFVRDLAYVGHEDVLRAALDEGSARIEPEIAADWAVAQLALGSPGPARGFGADEDAQLALLDALTVVHTSESAGLLASMSRGKGMVADYARCLRVSQHDASAGKLVRVALSELDEVRELAMRCTEGVEGNAPVIERILTAGLADESGRVQIAAARAAGAHPSPALVPFLESLARQDDPAVQLEAAGALLSH